MCDSFQDPSRLHEEAVSKLFQQDLTKSYEEVVPESWEDILPNDASNKASIVDLSEEQQIEYDEFLREMAGSWQAPDSDDEEGDEEEEEEETEETEGINDQEYAAFLRDFAGSWEAPPSEDSDEEDDDWVHVDGDSHDAVDSDKDELAGNDASSSKKSTCTTTCSTRTPSVAGSDQPSEEEKEAEVDDNGWGHLACYGEDLTLAQKEKLALLACGDGPIDDGYDVCQAIADYAEQRPGTLEEQKRSDIQASIDMHLGQAAQLWRRIENTQDKDVVSHYGQVCAELLAEVARRRFELQSLNNKESTISLPAFAAMFIQMVMSASLVCAGNFEHTSTLVGPALPSVSPPTCAGIVADGFHKQLERRQDVRIKGQTCEGWKLLGQDVAQVAASQSTVAAC